VFEGALISASSLVLASFFSSIISYVRSYYNTTTLCSHHHLLLVVSRTPSLTIRVSSFYTRFLLCDFCRVAALLAA
jgi:hypothetical protein